MSKLKQQKTELEVQRRNTEEELDALRMEMDSVRRAKDDEIKQKNLMLMAEKDKFAAKEIQFDELATIKLQLDSEIELYRNILNEAEQACGYKSPLAVAHKGRGRGSRNSRKRRRFNDDLNMTPMGPNEHNDSNKNSKSVLTPGLDRAAKIAQKDLSCLAVAAEDEEMKELEEEIQEYQTPGNIEGSQLQFSGLDLNHGMIEIQNNGESVVSLAGYTLSNANGHSQFELPKNMALDRHESLRIYVGKELCAMMMDGDDINGDDASMDGVAPREEMLGDYKGAYIFWQRDVWNADEADCARLYNPNHEEVARIEISPEMVDKSELKGGCIMM